MPDMLVMILGPVFFEYIRLFFSCRIAGTLRCAGNDSVTVPRDVQRVLAIFTFSVLKYRFL